VTATARSEHGSTLIEVLVSVVILGLAITAFLLGMTTSFRSSDLGRDQATGETLLISAGEVVKDPNMNPYVCGDLSTVQQGYKLPQPPSYWHVNITSVQYWDPHVGLTGTWIDPSDPRSCPVGIAPWLQGLTIAVTSPDGQFSQSRTYSKVSPP
jgi:type II secretory pathway pseudopilin PulG